MWKCQNFEAWHDRMPGKPATLRVVGEVTFPTSGYMAELRRHGPQGINPQDLLLDLMVTEPTGPVTQVVTIETVEYVEETDLDYQTVSVIDCAMGIPVQEVS